MINIQQYRAEVKKKTCTVKELGNMLEISYAKALRLTRIEGCPCMKIGRDKRIILSKIDEFLENHIGDVL